MLLRPSNTLLPTRRPISISIRRKALDALEDFAARDLRLAHRYSRQAGNQDHYIGGGGATGYTGNYESLLWSRNSAKHSPARTPGCKHVAGRFSERRQRQTNRASRQSGKPSGNGHAGDRRAENAHPPASYEDRKRQEADARRERKAADARRKRIEELESRIADREQAIKDLEQAMAAPGFYENHEAAKPFVDRHQP